MKNSPKPLLLNMLKKFRLKDPEHPVVVTNQIVNDHAMMIDQDMVVMVAAAEGVNGQVVTVTTIAVTTEEVVGSILITEEVAMALLNLVVMVAVVEGSVITDLEEVEVVIREVVTMVAVVTMIGTVMGVMEEETVTMVVVTRVLEVVVTMATNDNSTTIATHNRPPATVHNNHSSRPNKTITTASIISRHINKLMVNSLNRPQLLHHKHRPINNLNNSSSSSSSMLATINRERTHRDIVMVTRHLLTTN